LKKELGPWSISCASSGSGTEARHIHGFPERDRASIASILLDIVVGLERDMVIANHLVKKIVGDTGNILEDFTQTWTTPDSLQIQADEWAFDWISKLHSPARKRSLYSLSTCSLLLFFCPPDTAGKNMTIGLTVGTKRTQTGKGATGGQIRLCRHLTCVVLRLISFFFWEKPVVIVHLSSIRRRRKD